MIRVGILMPRSTLFPSIGLDMLNGLKQNLKLYNIFDNIKLITDNIGFGIEEAEIYAKAEKMLLQEDADMVVVFADTRIAEMLQPMFAASSRILMMLNFGANIPDGWQPAATTLTHSLNFCLHACFTGRLAAETAGKEAVNAVSYYDGGYHQCYSMLTAHQKYGGVPAFNHITHLKLEEFTLQPVTDFLAADADTRTLLCLFSGEQAERFYSDISPLQQQYGLNLFVTPMMLDRSLKTVLGDDFSIQHVKGYIPWHVSVDNGHNELFRGYNPNYFSLLGWDVAMFIKTIYQQLKNGEPAASIIRSLTTQTFESPRGWLKVDAATHYTYGPSYLATASGHFDVHVISEKENIDEEWKQFTALPTPATEGSSGWRNTYLCI